MKFIKIGRIHDDVELPLALMFQQIVFFSWHWASEGWEIINKRQPFWLH